MGGKMKKALLVLDMQEAFMNQYTKELVDKIEDYISTTYYDEIVLGTFINKENSIFSKRLKNNTCLSKEECISSIRINRSHVVMERTAYTMYTEQLENYLKENKIKYVYICGLDTDRSIYKTALDLLERGYYVYVIKNLCKSSAGIEYHDMAIHLLERQIGKEYVI